MFVILPLSMDEWECRERLLSGNGDDAPGIMVKFPESQLLKMIQ